MRARNLEKPMNITPSPDAMKFPSDIPSSLDINSNLMKPPHVSSGPVPSLLDIDPMAPFEFHFPAEEPWWDEYDCNHDMSDSFGSCDSLSDSVSDFDLHEDLNIYFNSTLYHISPQEDDFDLYHTHTTLFTTLRRPSSCVFFPVLYSDSNCQKNSIL